jgi:lysozyme
MNLELVLHLAASLCRRFEGLYLRPYLCPAGVPTIGYGATFYENGRKVQLTDPPITRQRAEDLLVFHLRRHFLPKTIRLCPNVDTPHRLAALCDFSFNLGTGNLSASTLRRKVNAGEWNEVPPQIMRWNKAGGREMRGLTLRRGAECVLVEV